MRAPCSGELEDRRPLQAAPVEPPLCAAENTGQPERPASLHPLQWSRRSVRRKTHHASYVASRMTALLQWSRRSARRKTHAARGAGHGDQGLQWSRRSARRKTDGQVDPSLERPDASMEPPLSAAENAPRPAGSSRSSARFNGAAAQRGGKQPMTDINTNESNSASMEPPLSAAENTDRYVSPNDSE